MGGFCFPFAELLIVGWTARGYDGGMIGDIRKLRQNSPFVPFTIHMADGRKFQVPTLDYFIVAGSRAVILNDNDSMEILPALLISGTTTDITALPVEAVE